MAASKSYAVSLSTAAALATNESRFPMQVRICPAAKIYVGGANVSTSNGLPVAANAILEWTLSDQEVLYGIADTGTVDVRVLLASGADRVGV